MHVVWHVSGMRIAETLRSLIIAAALSVAVLPVSHALAIDPPYQEQMRRLTEIMGSLYFLQPLCGDAGTDWREQAAELIDLDEPDDDRRQRLVGAFNQGYDAYARLYRFCTQAAEEASARLLHEAGQTAAEIHSRFAE